MTLTKVLHVDDSGGGGSGSGSPEPPPLPPKLKLSHSKTSPPRPPPRSSHRRRTPSSSPQQSRPTRSNSYTSPFLDFLPLHLLTVSASKLDTQFAIHDTTGRDAFDLRKVVLIQNFMIVLRRKWDLMLTSPEVRDPQAEELFPSSLTGSRRSTPIIQEDSAELVVPATAVDDDETPVPLVVPDTVIRSVTAPPIQSPAAAAEEEEDEEDLIPLHKLALSAMDRRHRRVNNSPSPSPPPPSSDDITIHITTGRESLGLSEKPMDSDADSGVDVGLYADDSPHAADQFRPPPPSSIGTSKSFDGSTSSSSRSSTSSLDTEGEDSVRQEVLGWLNQFDLFADSPAKPLLEPPAPTTPPPSTTAPPQLTVVIEQTPISTNCTSSLLDQIFQLDWSLPL
ncbi:hypothetical protein DFS34DRAFT_653270 [Phlyctochytrium arcticum]|nr:hypothetical protein DFS34DRAFT_653270 [Phlyctochytrium arcticum]